MSPTILGGVIVGGLFLLLVAVLFVVGLVAFVYTMRKKPKKEPVDVDPNRAAFEGVRPAPPEDLIDAGTVETLITRYNQRRRKARETAVLEDLAETIGGEIESDEAFVD